MLDKKKLRRKFLEIRKKNYFEIQPSFFNCLKDIIFKEKKRQNFALGIYYPINFEVNVLNFFSNKICKNIKTSLPVIENSNSMSFHSWGFNESLKIGRFGIPEPLVRSKVVKPTTILVPLVAYDLRKFRLGYGNCFYDIYLKKNLKKRKITTIGIAFSFQKCVKLPVSKHDIKLDYILTDKDFIK